MNSPIKFETCISNLIKVWITGDDLNYTILIRHVNEPLSPNLFRCVVFMRKNMRFMMNMVRSWLYKNKKTWTLIHISIKMIISPTRYWAKVMRYTIQNVIEKRAYSLHLTKTLHACFWSTSPPAFPVAQ